VQTYIALKPLWPGDRTSVLCHLTAGCLAGIVAQTVSYPFAVIKRLQQVQGCAYTPYFRSGMDCAKYIFRTEGFLGFYKGTFGNLLRLAPSMALQFAIYEQAKAYFFKPQRK
jgi:hypothetical protein